MALDDTQQRQGKLPVKMKLGYAIGQLSDSIGFNVFYIYFLYFLTDFAGISAGTAGTIVLIAIGWDAITDPIVGNISDNLRSKWGRRRPMMIASLVPYCICMFLLFNDVAISPEYKWIYFTFIAILFWSTYKVFVIPFFALGAELTDDFNERTSLRVWASVCLYSAVLTASTVPPTIRGIAEGAGMSPTQGWSLVAFALALAIAFTIIVCWYFTKGGERPLAEEHPDAPKDGFIKDLLVNMRQIITLRAAAYLAGSVFLWSLVSAMNSGALVYLMNSNLGYGLDDQTLCFGIYSLLAIAWLPAINYCSERFDKKNVYCAFLLTAGVMMSAFYMIGFASMGILVVFLAFCQLGNSTFWTLYYSMMYDISEIDEFKSGKRREGAIAALMSFSQKLGSAVALWLMGMVLELGGYDGMSDTQSPEALNAIIDVNTWIPGGIGILAALFAILYPVTRPRFNALLKALEAKRAKREYGTEEFEKLL